MTEPILSASGRRFAIATPHAEATRAGLAAFDAGGNAIDAALAAATTLAVVYPHQCGVGGDLFALVQHPSGDVLAINSGGPSPASIDPDAVRARHGDTMPDRGPLTVTVPGAVAGWRAVHDRGAMLPWATAFERAISWARDGTSVTPSLAEELANEPEVLAADPGLRPIFVPDGTPLRAGASLVQPALASTLRTLAEDGPGAFYGGDVGRRYASGLAAVGVPIEPSDLDGIEAEIVPPLVGRYRDLDVRTSPPTSQGFVLLEILAALERLGLDPDPLGPDAGALGLLFRAASLDRDLHLAEPRAMRVHPHALLDDGHIAALTDLVRTGRPVLVDGATRSPGGTIGLTTADDQGFAVALIQSLGGSLGSGILEPDTGIVAQSRGSSFSLDPSHPNVLAPGKRPAHTLMPVMAHRGGRLAAISATMGLFGHPQINAMSLIRAFDLGMTPADSVSAPRWLAGGMDRVGPDPFIQAEASTAAVWPAFRAAGFRVDEVPSVSDRVGHAQLLLVEPDGSFTAAADPRSDGGAAAR